MRDVLRDAVGPLHALDAGGSQDRSVQLAGGHLADPGIKIAAKFAEFQIGAQGHKLGAPPERTRTQLGSRRQVLQGGSGCGHQHIAHVGAFQDCCQAQPFGEVGGNVLHGVHAQVDAAFDQGLLDVFGEQPAVADLGKGDILDTVTLGLHHFYLYFECGFGFSEQGSDMVCLPQRQFASSCADDQLPSLSAHSFPSSSSILFPKGHSPISATEQPDPFSSAQWSLLFPQGSPSGLVSSPKRKRADSVWM